MKLYNHDITLYTHDRAIKNHLYAGRALGLTSPQDKIQLPQDLRTEWESIASHYEQVGLEHTHDVIWNISVEEMTRYPNYEVSVYFFGDVINEHDTYRQVFQRLDARCCQVIEFINSKNNFIKLCEELGIPVPKTLRFETLAAAKNSEHVIFPCYVKPAISDHGFGIMRCPDQATLAKAFSQLSPDEPLQIQEEVNTTTFLNLQYQVTKNGIEPILASEQILDGFVHGGNRYPSVYEPWDQIAPFAEWIGHQGMKGIFAVDVAVVPEASGPRYVAIECNPRFNGSSYPTIVAQRLGIPEWSSTTYKTKLGSLSELDLNGLTFNPQTNVGVILINWGTIQAGKITVMLAGCEAEQSEIATELQSRL